MIIDIHCHYTLTRLAATAGERFSFEPLPSGGPAARNQGALPTDFDSCVAPRALHRPTWRASRWLLRLPPPGEALDRRLQAEYERQLLAPGPIERFVLLAFDAARDDAGGCPPLPQPGDAFGSDMYTSNSLIRSLCRRHPRRFLFGASVHPYRPDAAACLEEVLVAGACLLKWLPLHQNIDVTDPRTAAVLRQCAGLGLPLLVHYGAEFTLMTQRPQYRSVRPLLAVLRELRREGAMPCVIVAHAATPVLPWGDADSHRALVAALLGEFADAPLYADVSALTAWAKLWFLRRLIRRPELHAKLLFGSDFPVPPVPLHGRRDPAAPREPSGRASWPQHTAQVLRRMGLGEIAFQRAAELLPNVNYFAGSAPSAVKPH